MLEMGTRAGVSANNKKLNLKVVADNQQSSSKQTEAVWEGAR
jgi:hypothetical protein